MTGAHWAEAWLGRPWIAGEHDCADFVAEVLRAEFGRALDLPVHVAPEARGSAGARERATSVRGWDRQIATLRDEYASRVVPEARGTLSAPQDGDGVLMVARGARRLRRYHLGLWAGIGGIAHVLHCQEAAGSILHPIRDLGLRALELEGIYRWR